ncbi:MAG: TIGR04086 family membrane protein [Actinomycetota bacterium]|nr:TIGR04086 family membrane protein [Actinomycetota bacterium]
MFGRDRTVTGSQDVAFDARGGVSPGAIFTGVVVAFGATFILSAIVGGVLVALGINNTPSTTVTVGVGAGIALVVAMFLAYLWGGYTAGRMARGAGLANGLLVPLAAIVVALIVGGIVTALGATANLNLPSLSHFNPGLPISDNQLNGRVLDASLWIGLSGLIAMFLGGAIGGLLGARWHTKLERHTLEERTDDETVTDRETVTSGAVATTNVDETNRTVETAGADTDTDRSSADGETVSAASTGPPITGGAAAETSEYPRSNPTVDEDSASTTTSTTGDTRA